jgi:hypothetical protein
MSNDLVKRLRAEDPETGLRWSIASEAADEIERLRAALRTIDSAIPKNNPTLPAICLVAGDVAESALNGTWSAFGVMPRAALEGKDAS